MDETQIAKIQEMALDQRAGAIARGNPLSCGAFIAERCLRVSGVKPGTNDYKKLQKALTQGF